jgi:hypothetical protein
MPLSPTSKKWLLLFLFFTSLVGFMIRLPAVFHHHDRALHFLFYCCASIFLNLLFAQNKLRVHALIFIALLLFGIGIEVFQELSNHLVHRKIHGNFDIIDIKYNTAGLIVGSIFWLGWLITKKVVMRE